MEPGEVAHPNATIDGLVTNASIFRRRIKEARSSTIGGRGKIVKHQLATAQQNVYESTERLGRWQRLTNQPTEQGATPEMPRTWRGWVALMISVLFPVGYNVSAVLPEQQATQWMIREPTCPSRSSRPSHSL